MLDHDLWVLHSLVLVLIEVINECLLTGVVINCGFGVDISPFIDTFRVLFLLLLLQTSAP